MIVLGIETSGPVGSLALRRDGRTVEERFLPEVGRGHAQVLVPEVRDLLRRHGAHPDEIDLVAVSVGPGSFTGLRVGVTLAKTFAYAAGTELAAVETFAAIAENAPSEPVIDVIADAQRGGLALGRYERDATGAFVRRGEIDLVPIDSDRIAAAAVLSGPGVERLTETGRHRHTFAAAKDRLPRASIVARLGESAARRGELADPWTLEPLYVRKSGAEEKREAARQDPSAGA